MLLWTMSSGKRLRLGGGGAGCGVSSRVFAASVYEWVGEWDGSVYPCDFYALDEYKLGNFNCNRLEEIDKKRKEIAFVEQSQIVAENCKNCKFYKICKGGCRRNKDFNAMNGEYENYFCKSYRIFFDICLERMIQIVEIIKNQKG